MFTYHAINREFTATAIAYNIRVLGALATTEDPRVLVEHITVPAEEDPEEYARAQLHSRLAIEFGGQEVEFDALLSPHDAYWVAVVEQTFDVPGIVQDLENSRDKEVDHDSGQLVASVFLGTVFSLTPSGKFYLPFACSNVMGCPVCGGTGVIKSFEGDPLAHACWQARSSELRSWLLATYGSYCDGQWPVTAMERLRALDAAAARTDPNPTCPACDGLGSREAWEDQQHHEAMDAVFEAHGLSVEGGEGDPTNILARKYFGIPEEDEEDDNDD